MLIAMSNSIFYIFSVVATKTNQARHQQPSYYIAQQIFVKWLRYRKEYHKNVLM